MTDWKKVADDLAAALRRMRDDYDRGYEDLPVAIADKALKWYEDACRNAQFDGKEGGDGDR